MVQHRCTNTDLCLVVMRECITLEVGSYMKNIIAMMLLSLLVMACAPIEKSRYREGDNQGQQVALTVADEKRLTEEALPKLKKDYPSVNNSELQAYVAAVGRKIVQSNNLEGKPYNYAFTVVESKSVNAFAMPAGQIFVTVPLIALASNEAELAGVIGHEIGHVMARHAAERMHVMEQEKNKTWLYGAGGGVLGGIVGFGVGKLVCADNDRSCLAKAAAIGAVAGVGGGVLTQKYRFLANSREDEMEADRIGFRLAVNAGYDKDKVGEFYKKLLVIEKQSGGADNALTKQFSDAFSTHPPSQERVQQMEQLAAERPVVKTAIVDSSQFKRARKIAADLSSAGR